MKLVAIVGFLVIALFTGRNLVNDLMISGQIPGAMVSTQIVARKWSKKTYNRGSSGLHYRIQWHDPTYTKVDANQCLVTEKYWLSVKVGDPIQVVRLKNSDNPSVRNDVFGNTIEMLLDAFLLLFELIAIAVLCWSIWSTKEW